MLDPAIIGQILWSSFANSSYFVLFALAFALVLKVNGVFNFAQGGVMTADEAAALAERCLLLLDNKLDRRMNDKAGAGTTHG